MSCMRLSLVGAVKCTNFMVINEHNIKSGPAGWRSVNMGWQHNYELVVYSWVEDQLDVKLSNCLSVSRIPSSTRGSGRTFDEDKNLICTAKRLWKYIPAAFFLSVKFSFTNDICCEGHLFLTAFTATTKANKLRN